MRKYLTIIFSAFLLVILGVIGLYLYSSAIYLPYQTKDGLFNSDFYADVTFNDKRMKLGIFFNENPWLKERLSKIDSTNKTEQEYYDLLNKLENPEVVLELQYRGYRSLVFKGIMEERDTCLVFRLVSDEVKSNALMFESQTVSHSIASSYSADCNTGGKFKFKKVSIFDFVFYDLLSCLGRCDVHEGIKYINTISSEVESLALDLISAAIVQREFDEFGIKMAPLDLQVELVDVRRARGSCLLGFEFPHPRFGRATYFGRFKCDNKKAELIEVNNLIGLESYFYKFAY